jgi:hypothetical protein
MAVAVAAVRLILEVTKRQKLVALAAALQATLLWLLTVVHRELLGKVMLVGLAITMVAITFLVAVAAVQVLLVVTVRR